MNTTLNRFKATLILTTAFCSLFAVVWVITGTQSHLATFCLWHIIGASVAGSFAASLAITNYISFLEKTRHES